MNMMKTSLAAALLVALVGCQSTAEPEAAAELVVNMSQDEVVAFMKRVTIQIARRKDQFLNHYLWWVRLRIPIGNTCLSVNTLTKGITSTKRWFKKK